MSSPRSGRSPQSLHLPSHQHESSLQASVPPKPGSEPCQSPAKQRTPSAGHPQRLLDLIPTRIDHLWSWHTTGNRVHRLPGKWIRALLSKKRVPCLVLVSLYRHSPTAMRAPRVRREKRRGWAAKEPQKSGSNFRVLAPSASHLL